MVAEVTSSPQINKGCGLDPFVAQLELVWTVRWETVGMVVEMLMGPGELLSSFHVLTDPQTELDQPVNG